MYSRRPSGIPVTSRTELVGVTLGNPQASHRQRDLESRTYRSTPLTPVAGMCGNASRLRRNVQRAWRVVAVVTNRTHIPAES